VEKYSHKLQQNITINPDNSVKCQDGTIYSKQELSKIQNLSDAGYMAIHKLKSAFNGTIEDVI
jgi:hypothetical protein